MQIKGAVGVLTSFASAAPCRMVRDSPDKLRVMADYLEAPR